MLEKLVMPVDHAPHPLISQTAEDLRMCERV
jgi:hypothetical protein